jgi:hypothetical protein
MIIGTRHCGPVPIAKRADALAGREIPQTNASSLAASDHALLLLVECNRGDSRGVTLKLCEEATVREWGDVHAAIFASKGDELVRSFLAELAAH